MQEAAKPTALHVRQSVPYTHCKNGCDIPNTCALAILHEHQARSRVFLQHWVLLCCFEFPLKDVLPHKTR